MPRLIPAVLLCFALTVAGPSLARPEAHIVAHADTGAVLSEHNADAFHAPASLTKMMLLYLAFRAIDEGRLGFDQALTVSRAAARQPAVKLGLRAGKTISVKDAVLSIVTHSANDAAVVLAEALGGTESAFARTMTIKARELGMSRTTFRNATGLPNRGQITSARDMLVLARVLVHDFPHHYHLFSTRTYSYGKRTYRNTNRLLGRYQGLDGLKTGYTRAAGFNLAASAVRDGSRLIVISLGNNSPGARNKKVAALFDRGFAADGTEQATASTPDMPVPVKSPAPPPRPQRDAEAKADSPDSASAADVLRPAPAALPDWGIELGAHRSYGDARAAAQAALARLPRYAGSTRLSIRPAAVRSGPVFRARLIGMNETQAAAACRALSNAVTCAPVSPQGITIASAN